MLVTSGGFLVQICEFLLKNTAKLLKIFMNAALNFFSVKKIIKLIKMFKNDIIIEAFLSHFKKLRTIIIGAFLNHFEKLSDIFLFFYTIH